MYAHLALAHASIAADTRRNRLVAYAEHLDGRAALFKLAHGKVCRGIGVPADARTAADYDDVFAHTIILGFCHLQCARRMSIAEPLDEVDIAFRLSETDAEVEFQAVSIVKRAVRRHGMATARCRPVLARLRKCPRRAALAVLALYENALQVTYRRIVKPALDVLAAYRRVNRTD
jgi:hypothetical protein